MRKNKFKSVSKVTIGVYVLAVLMGGIALYNVYTCYDYIASIVEQGFVISENLTDVINYYLSNVTPYAFYTICLGVMGYLVQKVSNLVELQQLSVVEIEELIEESENADEDYENLLKEIQTQ